jgi:hypothetical protein
MSNDLMTLVVFLALAAAAFAAFWDRKTFHRKISASTPKTRHQI